MRIIDQRLAVLLIILFGIFPVNAEDLAQASSPSTAAEAGNAAPPRISLDQALAEASASGFDFQLAKGSLGLARAQRALDLAKQGITLSGTGAYTFVDAFSQDSSNSGATLISKAQALATGGSSLSSTTGIAQSASAGLAFSTPLTKLTLSASQSIPNPSVANSSATTSVGLSGSQTLWDGYPGGQYRATLEKSSLTLQGKELAAAQSLFTAATKVKQSFLTMLAAQRDLGIKTQVAEKQRKLLAQIETVYAMKQASSIDLKTAQINSKSADIDVATAEKTLRLANQRLAALLGRPLDGRFTVAEVPDPGLPAASVDEAIAIGLQRRNDLAQYELSAQASQIDAKLALAQAQPGLSLTSGVGLSLGWASSPAMDEAVSVGAKLTLPIVDSGSARLQANVSKGQADLYRTQAAQLKAGIAADIRDYYETAQLLKQKADLAKESADLAEAQFALIKTQNQYGTATTQDVLTASVTAAAAEVAYGTAMNNYLLGILSLQTAMGQ
jgi:outer membrane protein TolC